MRINTKISNLTFKKCLLLNAVLLSSGTCEDNKPKGNISVTPSTPATSSKEEEERINKQEEEKRLKAHMRRLEEDKIKTILVGVSDPDTSAIKYLDLIASTMVVANEYYNKNFSKFKSLNERDINASKEDGVNPLLSMKTFENFLIEGLKEKKLAQDLSQTIATNIMRLFKIKWIIEDAEERKNAIKDFSATIENQNQQAAVENNGGAECKGIIELSLREFKKALSEE